MSMVRNDTAGAFLPADFGEMLNLEIASKSLAFQLGTLHSTGSQTVHFPLFVSGPSAAWVAELGTIASTDGTTDEVSCTPSKVAGMTRVSSELADDSNPQVANIVASSLVNQIAETIDTAFFGNTVTNGPSGLQSLTYNEVDTAGGLTLDHFVSARYALQAQGATPKAFVVRPDTAETLSLVKEQTGSQRNLLDFVDDGLRISGVPVYVSNKVDLETDFWLIPNDRVVTVLRHGTEVMSTPYSAFANDAIDIRAIARVGFAHLHPGSVVRGHQANPSS